MSDPQPIPAFSFAEPAQNELSGDVPLKSLHKLRETAELERLSKAMFSASETAYHWIIESDELIWSASAAQVIGAPLSAVNKGRGFATLLDSDNVTSRFDAVMGSKQIDEGGGVPYQIEYLLRPDGRMGKTSIWVEDCGRWFAGKNGRPAEVFGVVRRIDDRHRRDQHLSFLGNCDPLTGMMNRGRLAEALDDAIKVADKESMGCAFVVAGINNLAVVNDAYGFEVADEVIIAVGRRLRQVVRAGDAIARYSGSKFGIILNACNDADLATAAEQFLTSARESVIETERGPVWAMLSIGAIVLPRDAPDANTAMARAEEALSEAKRLPSDGAVVYQASQRRVSERSLNARCATEIVNCLKEDRFKLAYQPIVAAQSNEIAMHEALLRMADQTGELIAAAHLIPIAEKLGLVRLIDRSVVHLAVGTLLAYPEAQLSFNVSGITATDPRWFNQLTDILKTHREITPRLTVEITETVALSDLQHTARFTAILNDLGCKVAIDDFGAGFTSFRNLKPLHIDILKLDGSFCMGLKQNLDNQYFVRSLIDLAKKFELKTIAEWVESPEDAEFLRGWGIDYLQGNLFGQASLDLPWQPTADSTGFTLPAGFSLSAPVHESFMPFAENPLSPRAPVDMQSLFVLQPTLRAEAMVTVSIADTEPSPEPAAETDEIEQGTGQPVFELALEPSEAEAEIESVDAAPDTPATEIVKSAAGQSIFEFVREPSTHPSTEEIAAHAVNEESDTRAAEVQSLQLEIEPAVEVPSEDVSVSEELERLAASFATAAENSEEETQPIIAAETAGEEAEVPIDLPAPTAEHSSLSEELLPASEDLVPAFDMSRLRSAISALNAHFRPVVEPAEAFPNAPDAISGPKPDANPPPDAKTESSRPSFAELLGTPQSDKQVA